MSNEQRAVRNKYPSAIRHLLSAIRHQPLYTWLIALYPILFLYAQNLGNVYEHQVWLVLGAALIGVSGVFALIRVITRDAHKAGALTALLALAFFSYGHVYHLLFAENATYAPILIGAYALITLAAIIGMLRLKRLASAAPYLNLITAALVIMTLPPILSYAIRVIQVNRAAARGIVYEGERVRNNAQHPDVYYIVMDAYSANKQYARDWGYDNSAFTDALEARGFFVAYDSKTSYGVTLPSMASVLNMRYFNAADERAAQDQRSDADYMRALIADSAVSDEFRSRGYSYIFMLSGFAVPSQTADVNIDFYPSGARYTFKGDDGADSATEETLYQRPFIPLLLETTALRDLADDAQRIEQAAAAEEDEAWLFWKPERALMTWDEAERIPDIPEATFTVIHLIKPHEPIAFRRNGSLIPYPYVQYDEPPAVVERAFFDQLEFTNTRTLAMIDAILAKSSVPPIIIIQGDHGSMLGRPESPDHRRTNFEILNAYYVPAHPDCITDRAIIPINSFRAVLNCAFGAEYAMLDKHFYAMPENYDNLFLMEEVDIAAWEAAHLESTKE